MSPFFESFRTLPPPITKHHQTSDPPPGDVTGRGTKNPDTEHRKNTRRKTRSSPYLLLNHELKSRRVHDFLLSHVCSKKNNFCPNTLKICTRFIKFSELFLSVRFFINYYYYYLLLLLLFRLWISLVTSPLPRTPPPSSSITKPRTLPPSSWWRNKWTTPCMWIGYIVNKQLCILWT